jgi:hypothetical protein
MSNHPNRSPGHPGAHPAPESIIASRLAAGLTQAASAALIYRTTRAWQQWEAGDRPMLAGDFELYRIKVGQIEPTILGPKDKCPS